MWEQRQHDTLLEGRAALERTAESLARSERVAIETETIGASVVSELGQQREVLQRASNRLTDIDSSVSRSRQILNLMTRKVFTNKLILVLIIIMEGGILGTLIYMKFLR